MNFARPKCANILRLYIGLGLAVAGLECKKCQYVPPSKNKKLLYVGQTLHHSIYVKNGLEIDELNLEKDLSLDMHTLKSHCGEIAVGLTIPDKPPLKPNTCGKIKPKKEYSWEPFAHYTCLYPGDTTKIPETTDLLIGGTTSMNDSLLRKMLHEIEKMTIKMALSHRDSNRRYHEKNLWHAMFNLRQAAECLITGKYRWPDPPIPQSISDFGQVVQYLNATRNAAAHEYRVPDSGRAHETLQTYINHLLGSYRYLVCTEDSSYRHQHILRDAVEKLISTGVDFPSSGKDTVDVCLLTQIITYYLPRPARLHHFSL